MNNNFDINLPDSEVLVILGNGHNLGMDLRTSFLDYAAFYLSKGIDGKTSNLYQFLASSFQQSSLSWNNLEGLLKEYAINQFSGPQSIEEDRKYFESLRDTVGFYMSGEGFYKCKVEKKLNSNNLPVKLFEIMLQQKYKYRVLSFNYTKLDDIILPLSTELLSSESGRDITEEESRDYYLNRIQLDYLHIDGKKCIFGTDDDPRIPNELSFIKKAYQFDESINYTLNVKNYRSILIYGHSLGESDSDFFRILFDGMIVNPCNENPSFYIVTTNQTEKDKILHNLERHLNAPLSEIQRHITIEFILVNEMQNGEAESRLRYTLLSGQIQGQD